MAAPFSPAGSPAGSPAVSLAGKTVTVFGGSGFIGRALVRRLAATDAIVRVGVRHPNEAAVLKVLGDPGQVVPVRADITDAGEVEAALAGAAAAVNLVGILFESGAHTFEAVHHLGAGRVAAAAAAAGVTRLVHVSAVGARADSDSLYARTKAAGEAAVRKAYPKAAIVRPSVVFGPEDGFFNLFASLARLSPVVPVFGASPRMASAPAGPAKLDLYGGGGPRFQPVYVGDVAAAIVRILEDPATDGRCFELGGPKVYSFKELMELVLRVTGRRRLLVPVPYAVLAVEAAVLELLRLKLLTRDQVRLLRRDAVVEEGALTLADLGLTATAAEIILPTYLARFRPKGRAKGRTGAPPSA